MVAHWFGRVKFRISNFDYLVLFFTDNYSSGAISRAISGAFSGVSYFSNCCPNFSCSKFLSFFSKFQITKWSQNILFHLLLSQNLFLCSMHCIRHWIILYSSYTKSLHNLHYFITLKCRAELNHGILYFSVSAAKVIMCCLQRRYQRPLNQTLYVLQTYFRISL